jgi:hypothetical protein
VHGSNVTVRGLVIEKIANHAQGDPDEAHTIDDCEIRHAHGIGAAAVVVVNSHIHHCGEQGVSGYTLIQNNTIEYFLRVMNVSSNPSIDPCFGVHL